MIKKLIVGVLLLALGAGGVLGGLWYVNEKPETFNISEAINFSKSITTHSEDLATAQSEVSELSEDLATAQSEVSELSEDLATAQSEVSTLNAANEAYLWLLSRQSAMMKQSVFYEGENIGAFSPKYLNEATPFEYDFEFSGSIERNASTQTAVVYGSAVYNNLQHTVSPGLVSITGASYNKVNNYVKAMFDWGNFVAEDNSNIPRVVVAEDAQKFETALLNNERFEDTIKVILTLNNGAKALLNMSLNVNITNI